MTQKSILQDARRLIADEHAFIKDGYARNAGGSLCTPKDPQATQWCAEGAIYACDGVSETSYRIEAARLTEVAFRSEKGWQCVHLLERIAAGRPQQTAEPAYIPMLRQVVRPLSLAEVLALFDSAIDSCGE